MEATQKQSKQQRIRQFLQAYRNLSDKQKGEILDKIQALSIEGRPYSPTNQCLLAMQEGQKGTYGGFNQWRQAGKKIKKGAKGFLIFFPSKSGHSSNEPSEEGEEDTTAMRFFCTYIFHESQVEDNNPPKNA